MNEYTYLRIDTVNGRLIGEDKITEDEFFKYHYNPKEHTDDIISFYSHLE